MRGRFTYHGGAPTFTATFNNEGQPFHFVGTLDPALPAFVVSGAILTYAHPEDLVGRASFTGSVGRDALDLTLVNGVTITGELDNSQSTRVSVIGSGTWSVGR